MSNETKKISNSEKIQAHGGTSSLRGYPGYRTREGRSGLDPIDNDAEGGHMAGVFVRRLLTGKLRSKNPFTLLVLAVLGLGCISPLLLAILEALRGDRLPFRAWVMITISSFVGIALLVNLIKNLLHLCKK
jgi:hypothetical protein